MMKNNKISKLVFTRGKEKDNNMKTSELFEINYDYHSLSKVQQPLQLLLLYTSFPIADFLIVPVQITSIPQYGENAVSPHNQKEVQPLYYADTFMELYKKIVSRLLLLYTSFPIADFLIVPVQITSIPSC